MCAHVLVCSCERAEEVMRDECVIRFVGVRGGYKAMTGGVHVGDAYRGGGAEEGAR